MAALCRLSLVRRFLVNQASTVSAALSLLLLIGNAQGKDSNQCPKATESHFKEKLGLREDAVRSAICSKFPNNSGKALIAIAYEPIGYPDSTDYTLPIHIFWYQANTYKVLASYKDSFPEDGPTRIVANSLSFDAMRFNLARNTQAFSITFSPNVNISCPEGGSDNFISLYVAKKNSIRPLLKERIEGRRWTYKTGMNQRCCPSCTESTLLEQQVKISVGNAIHQGFHDLTLQGETNSVTVSHSDYSKKINLVKKTTASLRYNGKYYEFGIGNYFYLGW